MGILLAIHSLWRWVVLLVGIVAVVRFGIGTFGKRSFTDRDKQLSMYFSLAMDIQILLGVIVLVSYFANGGSFSREIGEHIFMMILAVAAVHVPSMWRKAEDAKRFRNTLIAFVASLVFVFIGVMVVGGWSRLLPM